MRELTSHKVNGLNESLAISVLDEPGSGGANHEYMIEILGVAGATRMKFTNCDIFQLKNIFKRRGGINSKGLAGEAVRRNIVGKPFRCSLPNKVQRQLGLKPTL